MLKRTCIAAAACLVGLPALAQDRGVEALEATAAAIKDMSSISFQASQSNSKGSMTEKIKADLNVQMVRNDDAKRSWNIRYTGTAEGLGTAGDEEGNLQVEVHNDGTATTWIDFKEEKVYIKRTRLAKGAPIQMATYGTQFLDELTSDAPFAQAIAESEITYEGEESIGGVSCDIIKIIKAGTNIKEMWWFGKEDHFPRKYITGIEQMGDTTILVSNVKINQEINPDDLTIEFPPNFEVEDRGPNRVAGGAAVGNQAGPAPRRRGTEIGNEAPDFELTNASGELVRLSSLRPNVVVLNFWGSWCLPCRDANDELEALQKHFSGQDVKVLALACKEPDATSAADLMAENNWTFELLNDASKTARIYTVRKYPTIMVIGREGEVVHVTKGYSADASPFTEITKTIEAYLANPPQENAGDVAGPPERAGSGGSTTSTGGSDGG